MTGTQNRTRKTPQIVATRSRRGRPKANADIGPTPETAAKLEPDVLFELKQADCVTAEQETAARELHAMWRALKRGMLPQSKVVPASPIPGRKQVRSPFARMDESELDLWSQRYKPWANTETRMLIARAPRLSRLELTRRIIEDNTAPGALGARHGMADMEVVEHLRNALDRYRNLCREKMLLHKQ